MHLSILYFNLPVSKVLIYVSNFNQCKIAIPSKVILWKSRRETFLWNSKCDFLSQLWRVQLQRQISRGSDRNQQQTNLGLQRRSNLQSGTGSTGALVGMGPPWMSRAAKLFVLLLKMFSHPLRTNQGEFNNMDRILPFLPPLLRGQFLYPEHEQKQTFFYPPLHILSTQLLNGPLLKANTKTRPISILAEI